MRGLAARRRRGAAPVAVVLNYHRIGTVDADNPLHALHTVDADTFERQLDHVAKLGRFASLDAIVDGRVDAGVTFSVTFDDVSVDARAGIGILHDRDIPVTAAVCTTLAEHGTGDRDKVYAIAQHVGADELEERVATVFGSEEVTDGFSFYSFTKCSHIDPAAIRSELVDPLFEELPVAVRARVKDGYLGWDELRSLVAAEPLVTIGNHGRNHENLDACTSTRRQDDLTVAHDVIERELGVTPRYFAVPFGTRTPDLAADLEAAARSKGYKAILWVGGNGRNDLPAPTEPPVHLTRLHTPPKFTTFRRVVRAALDRAAA